MFVDVPGGDVYHCAGLRGATSAELNQPLHERHLHLLTEKNAGMSPTTCQADSETCCSTNSTELPSALTVRQKRAAKSGSHGAGRLSAASEYSP
ncbi:hypothetical protein Vse01_53700 [Micromonospora sediminimaris]|uniref:Uncharacterized protein n=1 Tax=Micromonospora sediminimaris TaxID=547162 RepID=A0A9W5UW72_9ACTN|nr:hypothetical protein Vse01_53700 [Micromonospora sediminimaris]